MIALTAKKLKTIADHSYELTNSTKKSILNHMLASAQKGCYSYTLSFSDREKQLIPEIKDWLESLNYKCYVNNGCLIRISWEV